MIKVDNNIRQFALRNLKWIVMVAGYSAVNNNIRYYGDHFNIFYPTKDDLGIEINNRIRTCDCINICNQYFDERNFVEKLELDYKDVYKYFYKANHFESEDYIQYGYPIKTNNYVMWVNVRGLRLIMELTGENEFFTHGSPKMPIVIKGKDDYQKWAMLKPIKVKDLDRQYSAYLKVRSTIVSSNEMNGEYSLGLEKENKVRI